MALKTVLDMEINNRFREKNISCLLESLDKLQRSAFIGLSAPFCALLFV